MDIVLMLLPLVAIIVVLCFKKHMLVAGVTGGIVAVIVSWILFAMGKLETGYDFAAVNTAVVEGLTSMLSGFLAPIIYAAGAVMVARSGSFKALIEVFNRLLKGKLEWLAAFIVIVQALATYMAGMGAGNTMVIAPLMFAAVGFIPEVVAGMAIATAVCFTTSPASTETGYAAMAAGKDINEFANMMLPFTIVIVLLGAVLAWWGVYRKNKLAKEKTEQENTGLVVEEFKNLKTSELIVRFIPALVLILLVIFGGPFNKLVKFNVFLPIINVAIAMVLCFFCCKKPTSEICENLIDGSRFILTTLFGVGIFLGFINLIDGLGTFARLAEIIGQAPEFLITLLACVFAFIIAIPSGAFCAGVLALIMPTLSLIPGISPLAFGLIAISAGLGTQISPVQINVAALAESFHVTIFDIVKKNSKWVLIMGGLVAVVGFIVGLI